MTSVAARRSEEGFFGISAEFGGEAFGEVLGVHGSVLAGDLGALGGVAVGEEGDDGGGVAAEALEGFVEGDGVVSWGGGGWGSGESRHCWFQMRRENSEERILRELRYKEDGDG